MKVKTLNKKVIKSKLGVEMAICLVQCEYGFTTELIIFNNVYSKCKDLIKVNNEVELDCTESILYDWDELTDKCEGILDVKHIANNINKL